MKRLIGLIMSLVMLFAVSGTVTALADEPGSVPTIEKPVFIEIVDELGSPVRGASLQILDSDGNIVDSWATRGGTYTSFLPEGEYTLQLVDVPEGYSVIEREKTITVTLEEAERREDFVGECFLDHSHPEVCSKPSHIGIETYVVHDEEGTVAAYCFNQNYDNPTPDSRYKRLVGTPELLYSLAQNKNGSVGPQDLYDHVLGAIYHSGEVQAKYGLDDTIARYMTNMAIKSFTDPVCFISFDDEGNSLLERDENGRPIRDDDGNYVFKPGGTVLGSIINHSRNDNGDDVFPQEYRDAYHELISYTSHPADFYLYIYYPDNFEAGNTDTFQCLMSVFQVMPIRLSLSVRTTADISITKVWDDADDQDGIRPSVEEFAAGLHLLADGTEVTETYQDALTVTDNGDGSFTAGYTGLPKRTEANEEIAYTIREDAFRGYTADKTAAADGETITNTHTPALTRVELQKVWEDDDDRDGIRPERISVSLLADGEEVETAVVVPDNNGDWHYAFEDLPKYNKGVEILYTVSEDPVEPYEASVDGFVITNTYTPETTRVEIKKTWEDDNNRDGVRPESITVRLLADGKEVQTATVTPDKNGDWSCAFEDLPKNEKGKEIQYTITEDAVKGYETAVEGFAVTNTHTPETTRVEVKKIWDDDDDRDALRPESITIHLLADGQEIRTATVTPDKNGDWSYSFEGLFKYAGGKEIKYTITEDPMNDYESTVDGFTVTNKHVPATTRVEIRKSWDDDDNRDGLRPESITVRLLADGKEVQTATVKPDAKGNWTYVFEDLPKNDQGKAIKYTITEDPVKGYETTIEGFFIINRHTPERIQIPVTKNWLDSDNKDKKRPDSITVHLLADGKEIEVITIKPDSKGAWYCTFEGLYKYNNGKEIKYTITEDKVKGYNTSITPLNEGFLIRNSTSPLTGDGAQTALWIGLLAGSVLALSGLMFFFLKKKKPQEDGTQPGGKA